MSHIIPFLECLFLRCDAAACRIEVRTEQRSMMRQTDQRMRFMNDFEPLKLNRYM